MHAGRIQLQPGILPRPSMSAAGAVRACASLPQMMHPVPLIWHACLPACCPHAQLLRRFRGERLEGPCLHPPQSCSCLLGLLTRLLHCDLQVREGDWKVGPLPADLQVRRAHRLQYQPGICVDLDRLLRLAANPGGVQGFQSSGRVRSQQHAAACPTQLWLLMPQGRCCRTGGWRSWARPPHAVAVFMTHSSLAAAV